MKFPRCACARSRCWQDAGVVPESHAAKSLQAILEAYPRDELFQIDQATLTEHALAILRLQERQRTRVLLRRDPFGRFTSAQVFVPRDRYNTELRMKIGQELMDTLDGQSLEFTPMLTDSPLARIHYLVRANELAPENVDLRALEARIAKLAQRWEDDCTQELLHAPRRGPGPGLAHRFATRFPSGLPGRLFGRRWRRKTPQVLAQLTPEQPLAVQALPAAERWRRHAALQDLQHQPRWRCLTRCRCSSAWARACWTSTPTASARAATRPRCGLHDLGLQMPPDTDFSAIRSAV